MFSAQLSLSLCKIYDIMRRRLLFTIAILCAITAFAQVPKHELRAVWLTTVKNLDWPKTLAKTPAGIQKQKAELCTILDQLQRANVNTVLLQTRVRAAVIYPSDIEPWDVCMTGTHGKDPGYDALQFAIDECHKRGMECHAWLCTLPVGKWDMAACKAIRKRLPHLIYKIGDEGFMRPESPETADYLASIAREIVTRYDVDGIHLDYIRYPEQQPIRISANEARANITRIVRAIHDAVKDVKPYVKMSCSPIGKHADLRRQSSRGWNARDKVYQDAQEWMRTGLMDQLYPMMYFQGNNFYPFAVDWKEKEYGGTVAAGLGIYCLDRHEGNWSLREIQRQLNTTRQLGLGHAYFRSQFFTDNTKGVYDLVANDIDRYPALVPVLRNKNENDNLNDNHNQCVSRFTRENRSLSTKGVGNYLILSWEGDAPLYNVYASREQPVNTDDARNLIAIRLNKKQLVLENTPLTRQMNYAVTAMDRFGNERVLQQSGVVNTQTAFLPNDGRTLVIDAHELSNNDYFLIQSLQGNTIATRKAYRSKSHRSHANIDSQRTIDIAAIPDGTYQLRSVNKKGVAHRIAFFIIKR